MEWIRDLELFLQRLPDSLSTAPETFYGLIAEDFRGPVMGGLIGASVAWLIARTIFHVGRKASGTPGMLSATNFSEQQYQHIFDSSPVPTFICDVRKLRLLEVNAAAVGEYGYSREELLKMSLTDLGQPEEAERLSAALLNPSVTGTDVGTWRHLKKGGLARDVELTSFRAQFARKPARIVVAHDITRRKRMEAVLWQDAARFGVMTRATRDGMIEWDLASDKLWHNENYQALSGFPPDELPQTMTDWFESVHAEDRARVQQQLLSVTKSREERWNDEFRIVRKDQSVAHLLARGVVARREDGVATRLSGVLQDITARKASEERIRFLADHDELTSLPNRSLFRHSVDQAIQRAERNKKMLSILFFDLDRFKNINDSLGHDVGDEVLKAVAERLRNCLRKSDLLARIGGDEFAVLTEGLTAEDQASIVAKKILETLAQPMMLAGRPYRPMASIGISTYPSDGRDAPALQKNADIAMYRAKEEGRGTFKFYSEQLNTHSIRRLEFESSLSEALTQKEFVLHYQPKVDLLTGQVSGVEALIRWVSPTLGMVPPGDFIQVAEETGLIVPLGRWIVQTACVQNRAWQKGGLPHLRVAVNISARQVAEKGMVEMIQDILEKTGLPAESLELEITESVVMDNQDYAEKILNRLKDMGLHLTMDDFGTGYSSLAYLKKFPFDSVKIDQSFVRGIPNNTGDVAIIEAIIAIARSLHLKVVAEGVETAEQYEFLRKLGCDQIQGYYFSRPIPSSEIVTFMYKLMTRDPGSKTGS
ncbi:MAG: putative bifunctional diguanylate cyclase/phosphodiesterase [Burkholderiales bacterium]